MQFEHNSVKFVLNRKVLFPDVLPWKLLISSGKIYLTIKRKSATSSKSCLICAIQTIWRGTLQFERKFFPDVDTNSKSDQTLVEMRGVDMEVV